MATTVGHAALDITPELKSAALRAVEAKLRAEAKRLERIRPIIKPGVDAIAYRAKLKAATQRTEKQQIELEIKKTQLAAYRAKLAAITSKPVKQEVKLDVDRRLSRAGLLFQGLRGRIQLLRSTFVALRPVMMMAATTFVFLATKAIELTGSLARAGGALAVLPVAAGAVVQALIPLFLATSKLSTSINDYAKDLIKAGGSSKAFGQTLKSEVVPRLQRFEKGLRDILFPFFIEAIQNLAEHFDGFSRVMDKTAVSVGKVVVKLSEWATTQRSLRDFHLIGEANVRIFEDLAGTAINLLDVIRNLWAAAIPLTQRFTGWLERASSRLREITQAARDDGRLARFFERAGDSAAQWGRILGNIAVALFNTFSAITPLTNATVDDLEKLTATWKEWSGSVRGQNEIRDFFQFFHDLDWGRIFKGMLAVAGAMAAINVARSAFSLIGVVAPLAALGTTATIAGAALGLVAIGLTGLVGAFALAYAQNDTFREKVNTTAQNIRDSIAPAFKGFGQTLKEIGATLAPTVDILLRFVEEFASGFAATIPGIIEKLPPFAEAIASVARSFNDLNTEVQKLTGSSIGEILGAMFGSQIQIALTVFTVLLGAAAGQLSFLAGVIRVVGATLTWLNEHVVQPVWAAIKAAFAAGRVAVGAVGSFFINILFPAIGGAFRFLNDAVIQPVWGAIKAAFQAGRDLIAFVVTNLRQIWEGFGELIRFVWTAAIQPAWQAMVSFISDRLAPIFRFFRDTAETVWAGIRTAITTAYNFIRDKVFSPLLKWIVDLGNFFRALWREHIAPVWEGIRNTISDAWTAIRDKVFSPMGDFVTKTIPGWFSKMRDAVLKLVDKLKDGIGSRFNSLGSFFAGVVNAIGNVFKDLAQKFTAPFNAALKVVKGFAEKLKKIPGVGKILDGVLNLASLVSPAVSIARTVWNKLGFAEGGLVHGPGTKTSDSVHARLSRGEFVMNARAVDKFGAGFMHAINRGALPGMAGGGSVDDIIAFAQRSGIPFNVTSSFRNTPDNHGRGLAVDFGGFNQHALAGAFMQASDKLLELIHTTGGRDYYVKNGQRVGPGFYGAATNAQHQNHVHVAAPDGFPSNKSISSGGGGLGGFLGGLVKTWRSLGQGIWDKLKSGFGKVLSPLDSVPFGPVVKNLFTGIPEKILGFLDKKDPGSPGGGAALTSADGSVMRQALRQAQSMNASRKVLLALFEAGFVESNFRNLGNQGSRNDHDSLGFLQQRPSQGWGTPAQIMSVPHATRSFVSRAMPLASRVGTAGQLAQAVQRSAFPLRYDQVEARARSALRSLGVSGFDMGGLLQPGVTAAVNATGGPEAVLTRPQWAAMSALANAGAREVNVAATFYIGDEEFKGYIRTEAKEVVNDNNSRLTRTLTARRRK